MEFQVSHSPFIPANNNVARVMRHVLYALVPVFGVLFWLFGYSILIQLMLTSSTALCTEACCLWLRKRAIKRHLFDLSALITAALLALAIPSIAPWWISITGVLFAILIGKQVYGGLGYNPFNPAMVGYVFLLVSFPLQMSLWQSPTVHLSLLDAYNLIFVNLSIPDGFSGATVLDQVKTQLSLGLSTNEIALLSSPIQKLNLSSLWVPCAYCLGGGWLLYQKVIRWRMPLAVLLGVCLPAIIGHWIDPIHYSSAVFHLVSGATLCAAFFIATDPVPAPSSHQGRLIYGGLIGCLIYTIRTWGAYPDGVAFAVLLANLVAPSLDVYTRPKASRK